MPQVYVAGPVVRQTLSWDAPPWIQKIYKAIDADKQHYDAQVVLPMFDPALDSRSANDFFHEVRHRIASSRAMIAVYQPGDVSCAIEATIASASGKKVLVISRYLEDVPRLMSGLPDAEVISADSPSLTEKVSEVLNPRMTEPSATGSNDRRDDSSSREAEARSSKEDTAGRGRKPERP